MLAKLSAGVEMQLCFLHLTYLQRELLSTQKVFHHLVLIITRHPFGNPIITQQPSLSQPYP